MGQQQLLLVILVTIIVGIATVVAINTFGSASKNANLDAVRQDLATIASDAQGYFIKPAQLGGGGHNFTNITFREMGFGKTGNLSNSDKTVYTQNGTYNISKANADTLQITAAPAQADGYSQGDASSTSVNLTAGIGPNKFKLTNSSSSSN